MKTWQEIVIESVMDYNQAISIFGLNSGFSESQLKSKYKELSIKNHPDRGGSSIEMAKVNTAYEFLKKHGSLDSTSNKPVRDKENHERLWDNAFKATKNVIDGMMVFNNFTTHFESIFNETFKIDNLYQSTLNSGSYGNMSYDIRCEFTNQSREIVFYMSISAKTSAFYDKILLPGSEGELELSVSTEILINRRKIKLTRSSYNLRKEPKLLSNPGVIFPRKKIEAQMKKANSGQLKFSKKDFITTIERMFKPKSLGSGKDTVFIFPTGDDEIFLGLGRSVMLRTPLWDVMFYRKKGKYSYSWEQSLKTYIQESKEGLDFVIDLIKSIATEKKPLEQASKINIAAKNKEGVGL